MPIDSRFASTASAPLVRDGVADRRHLGVVSGTGGDVGQADGAAGHVRRPGRDRDRERAPVQRDDRRRWRSQTASADILRVISSSPTDVQPVFDAIVATAVKRLGCDIAIVQICSGDTYSPKAMATPAGLTPVPGSTVMPVDPDANFPSRAIVGKTMLHLRDWSAIELPAHEQARHEQLGLNSTLYLPLLRGDACVGVLVLGSKRANAFSDKAIALAESFRDQAVIAIENVAPVQRDPGGAGAADGDRRGPARDQRIADRRAAGVRRGGGARRHPVPRGRQPRLAGRARATARHDELRTGLRRRGRDRSAALAQDLDRRPRVPGAPDHPRRGRASAHGRPSTRTSARSSSATDSARCSTCRCCARARRWA